VARLEDHFSSRSLTKIGIQVTVDLTHENAAVLMTKPFGHLSKRHASHDTHARVIMPQVMKSDSGSILVMRHELVESHGRPHHAQRDPKRLGVLVTLPAPRTRKEPIGFGIAALRHLPEMPCERTIKIDPPCQTILGVAVQTDRELLAPETDIAPAQRKSLLLAGPRIREQF
jgi:hypothetical protein